MYIRMLWLCFFGAAAFVGGCRTRSKSAKETSPSVTVTIALKNIDDVDRSKTVGFSPEISCNASAEWIPGAYSDFASSEVEFSVKELKIGDPCRIRLVNQGPSEDIQFLATDKVSYETDTAFPIGVRVGGALWAEALLRRTYKLKAGTKALTVSVRFPDKLPTNADKLIAELKCTPEFEGLATGLGDVEAKTGSGIFRFDSGLKPGVEYRCRQIQVSRGSDEQVYYGDLNESFIYDEAKDVKAKKEVILNQVEVSHVSGVVILTAPGDACKDGEYFDIDLRKCQPNP
jgi:hypothetical protein